MTYLTLETMNGEIYSEPHFLQTWTPQALKSEAIKFPAD